MYFYEYFTECEEEIIHQTCRVKSDFQWLLFQPFMRSTHSLLHVFIFLPYHDLVYLNKLKKCLFTVGIHTFLYHEMAHDTLACNTPVLMPDVAVLT